MNKDWTLSPERILNRTELSALLVRADELKTLGEARNCAQWVRDWMILSTFIFTGLRRFEVCELRCIDFKIFGGNSHLIVRRGKGGKPRHVHLPKEYKRNVAWYLRWKADRGEITGPESYFLRSERSEKFSPSGIYKRFKKYCKNHRLHDARHTAASALLEATNSLRLVQTTLGHASLTTTQVYTHLTPEQSIAGMTAMEKLINSVKRQPRTSVDA